VLLSLDVDAEAEAAWDAVADAREAEVAAGAVAAVPLHEALGRLEGRFRG
jgi:hypothetical protein